MSNKCKNKRVGICLMAVASCIVLAGLWGVLATPEAALAVKPEVLHGNASFTDSAGYALQSDTGDPYTTNWTFAKLKYWR